MARFIDLTVTDLHRTTADAVVITLMPADGSVLPFTQGQYLTFRKRLRGEDLRRAYSICASPAEGRLKVAVKRVEGGAFSTWVNEALKVGDTLQALSPMGNFHAPLDPEARRSYLGIAAGSGITPVLSILKATLETEPQSRFTLLYANRDLRSVMFREELEDLKNRHMGRLALVHVLKSDAGEIDLFSGRLEPEKLDALFTRWIDVAHVDMAFICGPPGLREAAEAALAAHGLRGEQVKVERFAEPRGARAARRVTAAQGTVPLRILMDGAAHDVSLAPGQAVLDGALEAGLDAPFACKAGVCSTCRCRVVEGSVEMLSNHALGDDEVADGYALSCQAVATSPRLVVEYEQA